MSTTNRLSSEPVLRLEDYEAAGGGHGLAAARHRSPSSIVDLVDEAGLRGRGGAGFPTGRKWRTVARAGRASSPPLVVNAAEGEPGTFKDRTLLRTNPYLVLEGACIAARAVGAHEIVIGIKASFRREIDALHRAIDEIRGAGWTEGVRVRIVLGPDEYLFGEETALLEVIDGHAPFPRIAPPFRRGIAPRPHPNSDGRVSDGRAVLVDNVETLANVPGILRHGADWYRSAGTARSPGTILCTVTGATARQGVGEFAMGTPLREVIESVGGGLVPGHRITAVLSGVSNPPLGPDALDVALTYEDLVAAGSGLGSASFIVIDDRSSLVDVAAGVARFLSVESCGQCRHCKEDGLAIAGALTTGHAGGDVDDLVATVRRGARCALAGETQRVVGRLLEMAGAGATSRGEPYPIVPLVDIVEGSAVVDTSFLDKRPDWTMPGEEATGLWPIERLHGHPMEIRLPRRLEPVAVPAPMSSGADTSESLFGPLRGLHRAMEVSMQSLHTSEPTGRDRILAELRDQLQRHTLATEHLVYPLVDRVDPLRGPDVAWYPAHHEAHSRALLERLNAGPDASPRLIDELCAELQVLIDELDERVLPLLEEDLGDDRSERRVVALDVAELTETR